MQTTGKNGQAKIGVLALQGAFIEHASVLRRLGAEVSLVRLPEGLAGLNGLVMPGGESTTMTKLMRDYGLAEPLRELGRQGLPIFGTCAGLIMLARDVPDPRVQSLGLMDIGVKRNAFGRQVDSFEAELDIARLDPPPFPGVFIRAPLIDRVGPEVEVLARLPEGNAVAARQGNILVCAFHPELTTDVRLHKLFLEMVLLAAAGVPAGQAGQPS